LLVSCAKLFSINGDNRQDQASRLSIEEIDRLQADGLFIHPRENQKTYNALPGWLVLICLLLASIIIEVILIFISYNSAI
jgi:hypothetical protein